MSALVSRCVHNFYEIPIILGSGQENFKYTLKIRYDTFTKKYSIFGFASNVENSMMVRNMNDIDQLSSSDWIIIISEVYYFIQKNSLTLTIKSRTIIFTKLISIKLSGNNNKPCCLLAFFLVTFTKSSRIHFSPLRPGL